jgi:FkbM family methyltransferase
MLPANLQVPAKYWYGKVGGSLEPEMQLLRLLVQPGERVIDVGGNRGVYAYELWRRGCIVEIFEPNPICCRVLQSWAGNRARVRIHAVALSSSDGKATLHIPKDISGVEHDASASIEHPADGPERSEIVVTKTLDSYDFENASFMKIDVEGHELGVVAGASRTLERCKPTLLIEIEQRHNRLRMAQVFDVILAHDYEGYFLQGNRLRPLREFNVEKDQSLSEFGKPSGRYVNNFLFLHKGQLPPHRIMGLLS